MYIVISGLININDDTVGTEMTVDTILDVIMMSHSCSMKCTQLQNAVVAHSYIYIYIYIYIYK